MLIDFRDFLHWRKAILPIENNIVLQNIIHALVFLHK